MKMFKKVFAVLLALMILASLGTLSYADNSGLNRPVIVNAGSLNIRQSPDENATRISGATLGTELFALESVTSNGTEWYKVQFTNADGKTQTGYVMADLVTLVKDIGMVTSGALNVRATASTSATRIGGLSQGDGVYILDETEAEGATWYRILYGIVPAYVQANYVGKMSTPESSADADYKKDVTAIVKCYNVPKNYKIVVDGNSVISTGQAEISIARSLGQLTESKTVSFRAYDTAGNLVAYNDLAVVVDDNIFARISAFFRFIFSGFKWGSQTVTLD